MHETLRFRLSGLEFQNLVWELAAGLPVDGTTLPLWEGRRALPPEAERSLWSDAVLVLCDPGSKDLFADEYLEGSVRSTFASHGVAAYEDPAFKEEVWETISAWALEHEERLRVVSSDPVLLRLRPGRPEVPGLRIFHMGSGPGGEAQYLVPRFLAKMFTGKSHATGTLVLDPVGELVSSAEELEILLSLWEVSGEGLLSSGAHVVEAARSLVSK